MSKLLEKWAAARWKTEALKNNWQNSSDPTKSAMGRAAVASQKANADMKNAINVVNNPNSSFKDQVNAALHTTGSMGNAGMQNAVAKRRISEAASSGGPDFKQRAQQRVSSAGAGANAGNPVANAAKKDASQVAGKVTDFANKKLGGAGEAVANSNLGQQFLNSKTGQNFQKSKVGKWAMNNKGAAVGLAGAGLAAGGLAIGAAIKRHKEKKKMKEQAQMNAQAMGKSAMEEFTMYEDVGMQLEKIAGLKDLTGFSKKDSTTLKNLKAIDKKARPEGINKRIREIQAKRAGTVGAGAAAAGAAIGGAIALKKHLKKKKAEQKKEALDAAVAYLMEKEAGDGCKCKGKKGKLGNLMTDSTKSDQSADVTGRGGESMLRQKKALDAAVNYLMEKQAKSETEGGRLLEEEWKKNKHSMKRYGMRLPGSLGGSIIGGEVGRRIGGRHGDPVSMMSGTNFGSIVGSQLVSEIGGHFAGKDLRSELEDARKRAYANVDARQGLSDSEREKIKGDIDARVRKAKRNALFFHGISGWRSANKKSADD